MGLPQGILSEKTCKVDIRHAFIVISIVDSHGSIRAWRGLRHNEQYAIKLEKKKKISRHKAVEVDAAAKEEEMKIALESNPFTVSHPPTQANFYQVSPSLR